MSRPVRHVPVALGTRSYEILIGDRLLDEAGALLAPYARDGRLVVVADQGAWAAQGERLMASGLEIALVPVPAGESSKSWRGLESLVEQLLALGVERGDHLVSFGGGMVGDLAGFAASMLKRGCGLVQIPTTLLAQVDSSVGGKTAINAVAGKNLVGAFHQPAAVLVDPSTLDTLPARQLRSGYAEVVKYGLIGDPGFFAKCEQDGGALLAGDAEARTSAIETCVRAKAAIVAADERETEGRRALLNFGHTFGHALEAEACFSDSLLHGEAVSIGMVLALRFSVERGLCPAADSARVEAHLASAGLPTAPDDADPASLVRHMAGDKKRSGGRTQFVLTRGIGKAFVATDVELSAVEAFLRRQPG
jgi:3-dehydroquinate synthase